VSPPVFFRLRGGAAHGILQLTMTTLAPALALAVSLAAATPAPPAPTVIDAPSLARELRVGGTVTIEALVDADGIVRAANVIRSQPLLDDAATERVFAMTFAPATADTPAVATVHTFEIAFRPPPDEPSATPWIDMRCGETAFHVDLAPRPDSSGRYMAHWQASGLKSQELFVVALTPDGVVVDTTGSVSPQRFTDGLGTPGWPAWHIDGKALRAGGEGRFAFTVPETAWWEAGRIAIVGLFRNPFDGQVVAREQVWGVERDAMGPLLVPDPRAVPCAAGPWMRGR